MSFLRAARAALTGRIGVSQILFAAAVAGLAGLSISCGSSSSSSVAPNHQAYVTLPSNGSVQLLNINGSNGTITLGQQTSQVPGSAPNGLALSPNKKFLYVVNSGNDSISIFSVGSDGTLTLTGVPAAAGFSPNFAVIDPSGQYLLVTNTFSNIQDIGSVSVYSIDAGSGALTEVPNSPFLANSNPTEILITPSGKFVYVANPGIGLVSAFTFAGGALTEIKPGSPYVSGNGASGLAIDASGQYLYVANPGASNPPPNNAAVGNLSAFSIDQNTGALTPIVGSPYAAIAGTGPTELTVDPAGRFVYATTSGASSSIWCFAIDATTGQLTSAAGSPFDLTAGIQFALFDTSGNYFYIGGPTSIAGYTYKPATGALTTITGSPFSTVVAAGKMVISQ